MRRTVSRSATRRAAAHDKTRFYGVVLQPNAGVFSIDPGHYRFR